MSLRLPALLAVGVLLSGCAAKTPLRISSDGLNFQPLDLAEIQKPCSSPFRVCMMNEQNWLTAARTRSFEPVFASVVQQAVPTASACDVGVKFPLTSTDDADVVSAGTGRFIGRVDGHASYLTARALCQALSENGLLAGRVAPRFPGASAQHKPSTKAPQAAAAPVPTLPPPLMPRFQSAERPDDFAVVVGVENYPDLPRAAYAERDAAAVKAHLRALGVPERNIAFLAGQRASKSAIEKNVETWLSRMVKPDSRVYFYFSGHGAPDARTGQAYLVPIDGDPNFLENTGYPVKRLYERLGMLPAQQVLVAMDSCFSGAGGRSVLASGARPLLTHVDAGILPRNVTAMTASAGTEISGSLDEKGYGAFTYFFLEGLNGAAQDASGRITVKSLSGYLTPRVQDEARRLNRDQTPQLLGADTGLLLR